MAKILTSAQQKQKMIDSLRSAGITTEEQVLSLSSSEMLRLFPDIPTDDLRILLDIQKSVREATFYSFMCSD